ncbi:MAG: Lrp/AsnC family transcriptional regulator, partial [Nevskia sp.]|nr:Lrp/AsnC family transcriptional regulator [Nevskia sp.]
MTERLDALDLRILELLQQDVTMPVNDIAERVASSKSVVWRRVQRFLDSGIIRQRVAVLDPKKVGLGVTVFAHVKMARHGRNALHKFVQAINRHPEVVECHTLMGDVDFLLKIVVRDVERYQQFVWNELSQIEGVREVSSSISLTQLIDSNRLPLEASD